MYYYLQPHEVPEAYKRSAREKSTSSTDENIDKLTDEQKTARKEARIKTPEEKVS